ncbi:MAG: DUF3105 domain-containing protein [Solirubrobacteraceae bacterium]
MASRREEKERRRQERLAREAVERAAAARRRRLQLVLGGVLAIALTGGVVVAAVAGLGGGGGGGEAREASAVASVPLPEQQTGDLEPAAEAAGCKLAHPKDEGAEHESRSFTAADYRTNPPTSGTHDPMPSDDGVYDPGSAPGLGNLVHSLEHSRIHVQYRRGTDAQTVKELEALVAENDGYHMVLYENPTGMPFAVAATAWAQQLACPRMNDKVFDALRTFRDRYIDQGPEQVP